MIARTVIAAGGCQCGAVRYEIYAPLEGAHACHCRMCQRAVGGAFVLLAGVAAEDFAWTKGAPKFFASSSIAMRGFCGDCGTPLSFRYNRETARQYVTIGSLDDPATVPIERQFGVESRLPWVKFCEGVPEESTGDWDMPEDLRVFFAGMQSHQA